MIKNLYKAVLFGVAIVASATITSCSSEDEPFDTMPQGEVASRSGERGVAQIIDFERGTTLLLAGPTSYGDNLYEYPTTVTNFVTYAYPLSKSNTFTCLINSKNGSTVFSNGGIAPSQWNIMSSPQGKTGDWWYSYLNQCSVYNSESTDGTNKGAGAAKSNTFAVVYGYQDSYNSQWMDKPYFKFDTPRNITSLYTCNTSYTYGVIVNGNKWYNPDGTLSGEAKSLVEQKGWFKVTATGYGIDGKVVKTAEKYICDYRDSTNPKIPISTKWEEWYLGFNNVVKVEFNFEGSDVGEYGLNTPAYICIDNITLTD